MRICSLCKKKVSFFGSYVDDNDKEYCSDCWLKHQDKIEQLNKKEQETKRKVMEEERNKVKEYKRKCNQCGKVWHSLISQEKNIGRGQILDSLVGVGTAATGQWGAWMQASRNVDAQTQRIDELRRCPKCGSTNYTEEIITFKKK